ncbi:hypothetical protein [Cupriavidus sp. WS]|nr:hypothetical protein [Cupriavidus sp. WS]
MICAYSYPGSRLMVCCATRRWRCSGANVHADSLPAANASHPISI